MTLKIEIVEPGNPKFTAASELMKEMTPLLKDLSDEIIINTFMNICVQIGIFNKMSVEEFVKYSRKAFEIQEEDEIKGRLGDVIDKKE